MQRQGGGQAFAPASEDSTDGFEKAICRRLLPADRASIHHGMRRFASEDAGRLRPSNDTLLPRALRLRADHEQGGFSHGSASTDAHWAAPVRLRGEGLRATLVERPRPGPARRRENPDERPGMEGVLFRSEQDGGWQRCSSTPGEIPPADERPRQLAEGPRPRTPHDL